MSNQYIKFSKKSQKLDGGSFEGINRTILEHHNSKINLESKIKSLKIELENNQHMSPDVKTEFNKIYDLINETNDPKQLAHFFPQIGEMIHYDSLLGHLQSTQTLPKQVQEQSHNQAWAQMQEKPKIQEQPQK